MIGERLQELRKDRKMSQYELADIIGVSHYTVSSYECNRSDPDDKIKIIIAKLFDVSVDYLIGLIDEPLSFERNKNIINIPQDFTCEDVKNLRDYMLFLKYKKKMNKITN